MTLQLVLAYLFAAGTGVTIVYLARQNRKQGWQRHTPKWFGVEMEARQTITPLATAQPDSGDLMPQLLMLNRELAAHGSPVRPEMESPEVEVHETAELVSMRRS